MDLFKALVDAVGYRQRLVPSGLAASGYSIVDSFAARKRGIGTHAPQQDALQIEDGAMRVALYVWDQADNELKMQKHTLTMIPSVDLLAENELCL